MWYTSRSSVARLDFQTEPNWTVSVSVGFDDSRPEDATLAGGLVLVRDPNSLVSRGATDLARVILASLKMDG